jgi:hypothetical protein
MPIAQSFDDLVDREARHIARQLLEKGLNGLGLPTPPQSALDLHIEQLSRNVVLRDEAAERVRLRKDAYTESIELLEPPEVLDI